MMIYLCSSAAYPKIEKRNLCDILLTFFVAIVKQIKVAAHLMFDGSIQVPGL